MQITYQKRNGCVFQRMRETALPYKIGEETSMGWKVLNIEYEYNNEFYSEHDYYKMIQKRKDKFIKKKHIEDTLKRELKSFLYSFIVVIILYTLKTLFKI